MGLLNSETKRKLASTVQSLRDRLLLDLKNATQGQYRFSIKPDKANLSEEQRIKRERLENWLDEQIRQESGVKKETKEQARNRYLLAAQKQASATFLNRLIALKMMESLNLIPPLITGGWQSKAYKEFCEFAPELRKTEDEGYTILLNLLFAEISLDLPGLFSSSKIEELFPIPISTIRAVIEALNNTELDLAWSDDTTLGWVYQFWNDPDRKALDEKVNNRGKIEHHEIASKTQLFTERYMVEWLLQNSLNQQWLAICQKNNWTPFAKQYGILDRLEDKRKVWREKREKGEVSLEEMMPIEKEEELWKYWVSQSLPTEIIDSVPSSIKELKILDPAVGSGHFLVIAFDILAAFYEEEAKHRGEKWSKKDIAESIIENNLYGVDIDPRAVQIAAAALYLKYKRFEKQAQPKKMNLVASNLGIATLPKKDPAILELKSELNSISGISEDLTQQIIDSLKGADHLGSLLKVDKALEKAISQFENPDLFSYQIVNKEREKSNNIESIIYEKIEQFLAKCTKSQDLGLRLRGEQLAAGVRFIQIVKESAYDLVVANPPYNSAGKMSDAKEFQSLYPAGSPDLFSAFMVRGLQLVKPNGLSLNVTLSNWMYISAYEKLRNYLLDESTIIGIADLGKAAFSQGSMLINTSLNIFKRKASKKYEAFVVQPFKPEDVIVDPQQIARNQKALVDSYIYHQFKPQELRRIIKGQPLIYWWDDEFLKQYAETPKLGDESEVKFGVNTGDNTRFLRFWWESCLNDIFISLHNNEDFIIDPYKQWYSYIKGAEGRRWIEELRYIVNWKNFGLEIGVLSTIKVGTVIRNSDYFFRKGIAFSTIGSIFSGRIHRFKSLIDGMGSSVFCEKIFHVCLLMNAKITQKILQSLNPTVHFQVGDVKRLPLFTIESTDEIFNRLETSFTEHETHRETSVEFKSPGISNWRYTQDWAQRAVDREKGEPLPEYNPEYDDPEPTDYLSFAIGISLGRFGDNGEGIITDINNLKDTLPNGILYLSDYSERDSLSQPESEPILKTWATYGEKISNKTLKKYLCEDFFKDVHVKMYDKRPIYFPLSSDKKNFVSFINIHRWNDTTLQTLLADYINPELNNIQAELADLIEAKASGDKSSQTKAEKRFTKVDSLYQELKRFADLIAQCAEKGAPTANTKDTPREADAKFIIDLDDGVMINSAALWCLLESQWKDPKKWWSELCNAKGKQDYDWAHLAARYFPNRVIEKCKIDPSLAVAHGCFWKYHPAKAYEWELRLQDEIEPNFTIDEEESNNFRLKFEQENPKLVRELKEKERKRREKKSSTSSEDLTEIFGGVEND